MSDRAGKEQDRGPPRWLRKRRAKRLSPHGLPKGWRWLRQGEWAQIGDVCCDPRIMPVTLTEGGWQMMDVSHPVRTRRPAPKNIERMKPVVHLTGEQLNARSGSDILPR